MLSKTVGSFNSTQNDLLDPCYHLHKHIVQYLKYEISHNGPGIVLLRQHNCRYHKITLVDDTGIT